MISSKLQKNLKLLSVKLGFDYKNVMMFLKIIKSRNEAFTYNQFVRDLDLSNKSAINLITVLINNDFLESCFIPVDHNHVLHEDKVFYGDIYDVKDIEKISICDDYGDEIDYAEFKFLPAFRAVNE